MLDEKIINFLKEAGPIFFVSPVANRAIGLEKELPDFHIICSQMSDTTELLKKSGVKVFCLNKEIKNSGKLLAEKEVVDYIKNNSAGKQASVVTFKPSPMIEIACRKNNLKYLGNDWKTNRNWEDKVKFAEITARLGIPNANSKIIKIDEENSAAAVSRFDFSAGKKYVIQFSRGQSGNSTFLAESRAKMEEIFKNNIGRKIKIADYMEGETYTFDVCIGEFGILASQPIFQITGFSELNKNILGTCGNDYTYGQKLSGGAREKISSAIEKIAKELQRAGYRGILGFDFVVSGNEADIIEANPRLVGSIPVFTKLQLGAEETPFLLLHILSFLDFDFHNMKTANPEGKFNFTQVILRNTGNEPVLMEKSMPSGIYGIKNKEIMFLRESYCAQNLQEGEFFLECAPEGDSIDPDMEYANIQLPYGIMETEKSFKQSFLQIKEKVLSSIILKYK